MIWSYESGEQAFSNHIFVQLGNLIFNINIYTYFDGQILFYLCRLVYRKYCEAMEELSLQLMELLGMSLGMDRMHFRRFFEGGNSIMRLNYYPPCRQPSLTLGTGPHCDPTSLTILHQDQVGGLQVFIRNKWLSVRPNLNAFVVNIGDTFMVCSSFSILFIQSPFPISN